MTWQTIDTAPKDGTSILVFDEGVMIVTSWTELREGVFCWYDGGIIDPPPTHWMPLPAPPEIDHGNQHR